LEVKRTKVGDLRVRQLRAQQMLRGDLEGADLEEYVEERLLLTKFEEAKNWARKNAMWPLGFGLACCAIEMITVIGSPRNDLSRFGAEVIRFSPRQADMLILSGRVSVKMAPIIRRIYDQMLEPKWVISMGACASSAGMFNNYALVAGADKFLPVDVYVPGCPPRPEALIYGIMKLQDKITNQPDLGWRERYNARGTEEVDPLVAGGGAGRPEGGVGPEGGEEVERSSTGHARPEAESSSQTAGRDAPRR
jgi:NADH-quinone oxidoreductase subunit B